MSSPGAAAAGTDRALEAAGIRHEAIRALYAQMRNTNYASLVITVYMAAASWAFSSHRVIIAWVAVQLASSAAREGLIRAFNTRRPPDAELERWADYYVAHQAVVGLVWGSTIFLFAHPEQPITVALTLCCLYSIGAGAVPAQSYTPKSLYAVVGVLFTLITIRLVLAGSFSYILLGVASALFGLTMVGFCRVQARTLQDGFRIRFENRALVEALTLQTQSAEEARRRAELASLAKSQFLAAASHDLRQPLYALSLFSSSLRELELDEEGRDVVVRIQESIAVMESLFDGLLDISRLEAGVVRAHIVPINVDALFDRLSQVFHPIAVDRGLELRFRSDGEWVSSDRTLLEQVLSNLVANALRHTVRGGVLVAARRRPGRILFEVWDTGIGIADTDLERIFEEFVQIGNQERDRRNGLGLGLPIARRAAALIEGSLKASSRLGRGSRFALTQPRLEPRESRKLASPSPVAPVIERDETLPVMVVEDDRDVALGLAYLLKRWQVAFHMFPDADAALAAIQAGGRYGLILTDYRLPGLLNGLDLIDEARLQHIAPAPEAVLITGDLDSRLIAAAHSRNVVLLHKPIRPEVLQDLLGISLVQE